MCGLVGLINFNGENANLNVLKIMTEAIAHRGPDGEGYWIDKNIAFGHRRLAIIDLTDAARQPMKSQDGNFVVVYNGEVYNYLEIKKELTALGVTFKTQSDTEVVLNALIHWGSNAIEKFNGMFAFAFYNATEKKLLLARDRYGIKPLYVCLQDGLFMFASEQKALAKHPKFRKTLDSNALSEYIVFQNIISNRTLLNNVQVFPAGNFLEINLHEKPTELNFQEYWNFRFDSSNEKVDENAFQEEFLHLFQKAVERQLVSDVEVGTYLSGGMDSGSIAAIASRNIADLKTFTIGFNEKQNSGNESIFDERKEAKKLSAYFKTNHFEEIISAQEMEASFEDIAYFLDEPRLGQSYPNYYAAKLASKSLKVILSGTGGDEIFAGYPWRYSRLIPNKSYEEQIQIYYGKWNRLVPHREIHRLLDFKSLRITENHPFNEFKKILEKSSNDLEDPKGFVNACLYFEAKTFLHGLLIVEDRLSMAHGLETRVPFLDNELVDFAMRCPVELKLNLTNQNLPNFENNQGKKLVRFSMKNYLPEETLLAVKKGFSAPDADWFRNDSIFYLEKTFFKKDARIFVLLKKKFIQTKIKKHIKGKENTRLFIWSMIALENWMKIFESPPKV